jgi:hypothetical protein
VECGWVVVLRRGDEPESLEQRAQFDSPRGRGTLPDAPECGLSVEWKLGLELIEHFDERIGQFQGLGGVIAVELFDRPEQRDANETGQRRVAGDEQVELFRR